jgi:heme-degrading monooxygenase HmoA
MIARIWKGVTPAAKADQYLEYLRQTGVKDLRATEGNRGVYVLRRLDGEQAAFTFISLWESWEAIRRFAGDEIERAVYYVEDEDYLLALDPWVSHHEVLVAPHER